MANYTEIFGWVYIYMKEEEEDDEEEEKGSAYR
jgi:hypothetical protein